MGLQLHQQRTASRGFTLVELLLTLTLILLLAGAVIFNFGSLQRGSQLDEGATQLEALFRFARAEASSTGRPVRVILAGNDSSGNAAPALLANPADPGDSTHSTNAPAGGPPSNGGIDLHWESDPFGAPGRFEQVAAAVPLVEQINELVRVVSPDSTAASSDPAGTSLPGSMNFEESDHPDAPRPPVTFYPDGSSDNCEVMLMARNEDDPRRMVVRLTGATGTLHRRWVGMGEEEPPPPPVVPPPPVDPVTGPPAK